MLTSHRAVVILSGWLLVHLAVGIAIWTLSPGAETVWFHLGRWLTGIQDSDSWRPIEIAARRGAVVPTGIYADVFFAGHIKFQYPLTAVTLIAPFDRPALNAITWAAVGATAVTCALLLRHALREARTVDIDGVVAESALFVLVMIAVLSCYPVLKAYSLGQVQAGLTLLFALALFAWQRGSKAMAGVAVGVMLLVKPSFGPVLLWGMVRREWRFTIATLLTGAAGLLVSLTQFPLVEQTQYLHVLRYIGQRGELFYANQSLNGLLNRWIAGGGSMAWQPGEFAPPNTAVAAASALGAVLLIVAAFAGVGPRARRSAIDLAVAGLASTAAAPIAWEHHYGIIAPMLAVSWPAVTAARPAGALTGPALFGLSLVSANYFQVAHRLDGTWLNPLQSYLWLAALAILALTLRATRLSPA